MRLMGVGKTWEGLCAWILPGPFIRRVRTSSYTYILNIVVSYVIHCSVLCNTLWKLLFFSLLAGSVLVNSAISNLTANNYSFSNHTICCEIHKLIKHLSNGTFIFWKIFLTDTKYNSTADKLLICLAIYVSATTKLQFRQGVAPS